MSQSGRTNTSWPAAGAPAPESGERVVRPKVVPLPEFGVAVFESRHAPGFSGRLQDSFSKFLLVIAGQAIWATDKKQVTVERDSLVHVPAGLSHTQEDRPHNPVVLYAIHYRPEVLPDVLVQSLDRQGLLHWNLSRYLPMLGRSFRLDFQEMLFEQGSRREGWEWLLRARLVELAVRTMRNFQSQESGQPLFIKGAESAERVASYTLQLQSQFYLQQNLDDAASAVGLSRRQFTYTFRQVTGQSWKQYINKLRLDHCRKLLLETDKTVTAAAFESGFEDLSYFNHAFKKAFACSPLGLRQNQTTAKTPSASRKRSRS
jgi:AraC-like DNA-binding protein